MIWLTSDTHFNHANIIRYSSRPFADVNEMNEALIARWNRVVQPLDTIYHLGDFGMGTPDAWPAIVARLNGRKLLVLGNHDRHRGKMISIGFDDVLGKNVIVNIDGVRAWLNHYPPRIDGAIGVQRPPAPGEYDIALCGHVHQLWKVKRSVVNVGVDVWDYRPIALSEAMAARASCADSGPSSSGDRPS